MVSSKLILSIRPALIQAIRGNPDQNRSFVNMSEASAITPKTIPSCSPVRHISEKEVNILYYNQVVIVIVERDPPVEELVT